MQPNQEIPAPSDTLGGSAPQSLPPIINSVPPPAVGMAGASAKSSRTAVQRLLSGVLSVCLGLFLADGVVSLADDACVLLLNVHALMVARVLVYLVFGVLALVVYGLMGLTLMVPKRFFVPLALFNLLAQLLIIPVYIYDYRHVTRADLGIAAMEVLTGLAILFWAQGGFKLRWPLVPEERLGLRGFSWANLCLFVGLNLFVLLPGVLIYLWVCAARATDHFSDSFMALRPGGFTVQVRTYVRDDGKRIELVPMAHIGEPEYYRALSRSFPTNGLILMEGVTDNRDLLTNKITYHRVATSLGLAEQQREFKPQRERVVRADVDVNEFAPSTIDLLNAAMLVHTRGLNAATLSQLAQYSPPPHFEERLIEDILRKRNRRLLEEINKQLPEADVLIVPWGVAHMPEIAKAIQKEGFKLKESRDYIAIRFGSHGKQKPSASGMQGAGH